MLGWMLGRGENAPDAVEGDTTQIDVPDTPAPVFAARAFKSALFGTPVKRGDSPPRMSHKNKIASIAPTLDQNNATPLKPQGILLTPGTGTTRRKRVSFNHEALASTKTISPNCDDADKENVTQKRPRLSGSPHKSNRKANGAAAQKVDSQESNDDSDEWEEEGDEADEVGAEDMTLDLNEPHSQSGKYWKGQFVKYHQEARTEIEKLLKYKQMAKSYARQKDTEAIQLAERLKEEQEKVILMEKKITENASQMVIKQKDSSEGVSSEILATLTKQTALAAQYRHRVQELEEQLGDLLQGREDNGETKAKKRRAGVPSPTTQRTLIDTQRELRRARAQLRELDVLREQVSSLKSQLKQADKRAAADSVGATEMPDSNRAKELKAKLKLARDEAKKKDHEIAQLKAEFEDFRKETETHDADSKTVLERAHTKISELKKEVKALKASNQAEKASEKTAEKIIEKSRPRSWHVTSEDDLVTKDDIDLVPSTGAAGGVATTTARRSLDLTEEEDDANDVAITTLKSRTLREKYQEGATKSKKRAEGAPPTSASHVLADRPNLEKPRWQPFVPRSPRNRAYLDDDLTKTSDIDIVKKKYTLVPDLPVLAKSMTRAKRSNSLEKGDIEIDLLQDRFARLGGPDAGQPNTKGSLLSKNVKTSLPPERRAAALARIEKRMAEKRALKKDGVDKENIKP